MVLPRSGLRTITVPGDWDQEYRIFVLLRSGLLQSSGCQIRKKSDEIMINNCNSMLQWAPINVQNWFQTITSKEPLPPPRGSRHHKHTMFMPVHLAALLDLLFILHPVDAHGYLKSFISQLCFLPRWKNTDAVHKVGQHLSFHGNLWHHWGL